MSEEQQQPEENEHQGASLTFFVLMWVVLFALAVMFFDQFIQNRQNPNSDLQQQGGELELRRNYQGHFVLSAQVNAHTGVFLVDTGATDVVLNEDTARRAGLKKGQPGLAETAAGTVTVYSTTIERLQLGGITLHKVRASINPSMDDDLNLLGMSALGQLELRQKGNTLTLRR